MHLWNFYVVSKSFSNLYWERVVSNCKQKEWLNNEVESFLQGDKKLKFTSRFVLIYSPLKDYKHVSMKNN